MRTHKPLPPTRAGWLAHAHRVVILAFSTWAGIRWLLCLVCLVLLAAGCNELRPSGSGSFTPRAPQADTPDAPLSLSPLEQPEVRDTGWVTLQRGVSGRRMMVEQEQIDGLAAVHMVRLDPAAVAFEVGYAPGAPRFFGEWCAEEGIVAAINGGFFDADFLSTALVVEDGKASGTSYQGQGGMFAIDQWGNLSLRHLAEQPYDPAEPLQLAIQSWPMLVTHGQSVYTSLDDGIRARRSVIAFDRSGHVLLMAFPGSDFTLRGLADWLVSSGLEIETALNLDGGSSTGLCVNTEMYQARLDAFSPLPMVLLVRPR